MKTRTKHLSLSQNKILFCVILILITLIYSCEEKLEEKDYVARVGDSFLTENELEEIMLDDKNSNYYRDEFVRKWIDEKILFKEAAKAEIQKDSVYLKLVDLQKEKFAISLYLDQVINQQNFTVNENDIKEYFGNYRDDFQVNNDVVIINKAVFVDETFAEKFRSILVDSDWQRASNVFRNDETVSSVETGIMIEYHKLQPRKLQRIVQNLLPTEVSIVVNTEQNVFVIVQLVAKLKKGTIPELDDIYDQVSKRYLIWERNKFIRNFIRDLRKKYMVEIKR